MNYLLALLFFLQGPSPLNTLVDGVEKSFARMNDYSSDFVQISKDVLNRKQEAAGHLYLKKSRMAGGMGV